MKKRVGIFGGTFDPVHSGHVRAVQSFLASGLVDEIWVVLTPFPPHKASGLDRTSFEHRLNMLRLAFDEMNNVKVSTVESELPQPSYTFRTLQHLKREFPDTLFFLCLGEDSVETFHSWYHYRDILEKYTLLAVRRPGSDMNDSRPEVLEKTIFVDHESKKVSSTAIRNSGSGLDERVPDRVAEYIRENELYT